MYQKEFQTWEDQQRHQHQLARFHSMAERLVADNPFYQKKWKDLSPGELTLGTLSSLPLLTKQELLSDQQQHPPFGTNLTFPTEAYVRIHQTSGTTGTPLRVLDTQESWAWWANCWRYILDAAGVTSADRVMLAFSFGPFIGFWGAQEAVAQHGALMVPGGGMTSQQRLAVMKELGVTVLLCTPSYALHLAEVAEAEGINLAEDLEVRISIHAGEPGAGIPATRERIEKLWGCTAFDHPGASEVGAFGFSCKARNGIHINEAEFIAEVIDPETGNHVKVGETGELVLTNLGRVCFPVVRYRTHDIVRPMARGRCECGRTTLMLEGGILGRSDDMVTIRGVNVFPSALLEIFNGLPHIGEHRVTAYRDGHMDELHVEYEDLTGETTPQRVAQAIREKLSIRVSLKPLPAESLPRYELKAKRFVDRRKENWQPSAE